MDKSGFIPPPPVDGEVIDKMLDAISDMAEADWDQLRRNAESDPYIREKYIRRLKSRKKEARKRRIREWWKNNWKDILSFLITLIGIILPFFISAKG